MGISSEIELAKPSREFFEFLLQQAQCRPDEAIMVGDRIDNDIRPAKALGMRTIWVKWDHNTKGYAPTGSLAKLYLDSQCRASTSTRPPQTQQDQPDMTVESIQQIPKAVEKISRQNY